MKRVLLFSTAMAVSFAAGTFAHAAAVKIAPEARNAEISIINVNADDEALKGAEGFIGSVADRGIGFLSDEGLSMEKRKSSFRSLLQKNFDIPTIARFALGRYWKVATPAEQKEYSSLFENMIIEVYSSRFGEYNGEKLEVRGSRAEGKNDILVNSAIVPANGQDIQLDWRVRYKGGQYKVVDVIVEGVSMAVTQRSDFSSVIQRGGGQMEVLLAHLRAQ